MAVHRLDEVLAKTDPFDLAQAVERHVSALEGDAIRALLRSSIVRAGRYYRDELSRLLAFGADDLALRKLFVLFLKSNLRAINLFGPGFAAAILSEVPANRVVGIGEEQHRFRGRTAVLIGTAVALMILGAAAEHAYATARASAQVPEPLPLAAVETIKTPAQRFTPVRPHRLAVAASAPRSVAPAPSPAPQPVAPVFVPPERRTAVRPPNVPPPKTPAPGAATLTVNAAPRPTAEPTPLDANDMPQAFSDATPLPEASAQAAQVQGNVSVPTLKPTAKPHSWLHRTLMHFDPFQPGGPNKIQ